MCGEHDLPEAQTAVVATMTCVMVPFQIDLCGCERVTGLVVDAHFHDVIFNDEWAMRYAGQPCTTDCSGCDSWRVGWECRIGRCKS